MLHKIVFIIVELTIGLSICVAFHTQITAYDGIQNIKDFDLSPFVQIGDNYYLIETTEKLNWFAAAHQCRKKGTNLASIETEDEMKALDKYLLANYPDEKYFWTSGNDLGEKHRFQWLSTGQSLEYKNWDANEPNNYGGNEDCVDLYFDSHFKFNDAACNVALHYICEADKPKEISIAIW